MIDVLIPTYKRPEKLAKCVNALCETGYSDIRIIILPDLRRMWYMALMNEGFKLSTVEAVLPISDDIEFKVNSLSIAFCYLKLCFPDTDGVVGIKQEGFDNNQTGLLMIGKKFLERFPNKQAFCPEYKSLYCDTELALFAQKQGKFAFCEDAVAIHYHPALYPEKMDKTHDIGREHKARDIKTWNRRQADGLLWGESFKL